MAVRLTSFEPISDWHRDLEAEFFRPENVVELITLAHTYAKGVSASGFFVFLLQQLKMHNKAMQVTNQMFVRVGYEVEIYPDPEPAEAQDEGEPLEEGLMRPSA